MKKLILVVTFVAQLGSMASANTIEHKNSRVFTESNRESFQTFIEKQAPMFFQINSDSWKNFQKVVTYYTSSKSNLLKMNASERRSFLLSSDQLVKELKIMNSSGSKQWIDQITTTTAIIRFTWSVLEENTNVEFEQAPPMPLTSPVI